MPFILLYQAFEFNNSKSYIVFSQIEDNLGNNLISHLSFNPLKLSLILQKKLQKMFFETIYLNTIRAKSPPCQSLTICVTTRVTAQINYWLLQSATE